MPQAIADAAYRRAAEIYTILSHSTALHILTVLSEYQNRECSAAFLVTGGIPLSAVSYQLKRLISIGAVRRETLGNKVYYKLSHGRIETINAAAARLL
jgi:DNA-binding transcriptional ArsR family regulator